MSFSDWKKWTNSRINGGIKDFVTTEIKRFTPSYPWIYTPEAKFRYFADAIKALDAMHPISDAFCWFKDE